MKSSPLVTGADRAPPLVNGGGDIAVISARTVLLHAPRLTLAAHELPPGLSDKRSQIDLLPHAPRLADVEGRAFVISATGDDIEDARVSGLARRLGVPVNVPDRPELCAFAFGALVERGDLPVAISADGAALDCVAAIARVALPESKRAPAGVARRKSGRQVPTGAPTGAIQRCDADEGRRPIEALDAGERSAAQRGRVVIVGAGPGDPDLLTVKAVRALKAADVILYDSLVDGRVLDHARRDAVLVEVGKRAGKPSARQRDINAEMIGHARAGKVVIRLKGGDAFVFGRAAEEIAAVEAAGIAVEIVPGITAAQACAVDARLPLTYRGQIRAISLVAGASTDGEPDLDWDALARPEQALAVYMGVKTAPDIVRNLLEAGAAGSTPAVIVENGGRPEHRTIATTLRDVDAAITHLGVAGPAILFIGLDWSAAGLNAPPSVERFSVARASGRAANAPTKLAPPDQPALSL